MKQLLTIEYLKLRKLRSLQIIFLIYAIISPVTIYAISSFITNFMGLFFPKVCSALQFLVVCPVAFYESVYLNLLLGIWVVILISNEKSFKKLRKKLII